MRKGEEDGNDIQRFRVDPAELSSCLSLAFGALYLSPIIWSCGGALLPFQKQLQKENVPLNHSWHLSRHRIRNGNWLSHYCSDRFSADYCQECFLRLVKTGLKTGGLLCANDSSQTRKGVQSFQRPHSAELHWETLLAYSSTSFWEEGNYLSHSYFPFSCFFPTEKHL